MVHLLESALLVLTLCTPPALLYQMLARRRHWASEPRRELFRKAMIAVAVAIAFNLTVSIFAAPRFQVAAISDGIAWPTLIAMFFAWASFWGSLALSILAPRRRYRLGTDAAA